ncbi:type II toxin-antitoxin system VapC family toxin [Candidatus Pacearchaeota archaeon]|nr:type II toxin-antitoxin system VapC family toxin [Candidatus Pacearchaeota archaeon]
MKKKYIDANIFIQGILRNDNNSKNVILKIANKEFIGVTSVLSWDEITFIVKKFLGKGLAEIEGKKFFSLPNFIFVDAKKDIIIKAQKLFEEYNLMPRDAIHAATAIYLNIDEMISEDIDFDKIKELKRINPVNV